MKKRWVVYNGNYYYLNRKGVRLTGTKAVIDGKSIGFCANGSAKRRQEPSSQTEGRTGDTGNR